MRRPLRLHLAWCDYCDRKIAWSRKRQRWLALFPFVEIRSGQLARRLICPSSPNRGYHDPKPDPLGRALAGIGGVR